jgi:glycosyltransferase involved in cell wall biosynthesis
MRVCFLGLDLLPALAREYAHLGIGGAQLQMSLIAKALVERGHAVSMVVSDYGQPDGAQWHGVKTFKTCRLTDGVPVLRFVHPRWTSIWSALRRADADVYFTSCAGMHVGLLAMFCRAHQRGFVFRLAHDSDADPNRFLIKYRRDKWLYAYGLQRAHTVLCQNEQQRSDLLRNYGIEAVPIRSLSDKPEQVLPLSKRDIAVLWVNNIRELKRPDLALDLAARLPEVAVHVVGGELPQHRESYRAFVQAAQTQPNVHLHGRVPYHDVGRLYDRARVFVNTSDSEGFPNSFLMAWRRGVPVVSFVDPDGLIAQRGLGCKVSSLAEMATAVARLLSDAAVWQRVSARCTAYMDQHFSEEALLTPYLAAIQQASSYVGRTG